MNRPTLALAIFVAVALPGAALLTAQSTPRSAQPQRLEAQPVGKARPGLAAEPVGVFRPAAAIAGKSGIPDPALFDGSKLEPEKRPDRGMLAEFEVPGEENPSQRVGGAAGGEPGGEEGEEGGGGGAQREQSAMAAGRSPVENDPNAKAEGASAQNLQIPEGAQADQSAAQARPQNVSLGDAAMQIQTAAQQNTVGAQQQQQAATNTQQYEKGAAQGNQRGDNNNRGLERGQAVPQGL